MAARPRKLALVLTLTTGSVFAMGVTAQTASAADLVLGAGSYTADTSALTLTGPSTSVHGVNVGGIAVFKFGTIAVPSGASITAVGTRPFELLATNSLIFGGTIVSSGTSATNSTAGPNAGGAGGGAGGTDATQAGHGPGGGGHASIIYHGGGGGGFASKGARGGLCTAGGPCATGTAGARGAAYGNLNVKLQGGSGGGGASNVGGGGGGGAIGLFGASVTLQSTAVVIANGGSGGGIIIHGKTVQMDGVLEALGGDGGGGGCCGDGGGGSGGRIAVQYKSLSSHDSLLAFVAGGSSGTVDFAHGGLSPDANGGHGVMTFVHIDASVLTIGKSKTVKKGTTATIATRLTDRSTAAAIAGQRVLLYKRTSKTAPWSLVASRITTSTGRASVARTVKRFTQFQWRYAGNLIHDPTRSPIQSVGVV